MQTEANVCFPPLVLLMTEQHYKKLSEYYKLWWCQTNANCRKRHSELTRNSYISPTKRRENREFFDRALRLGEELYAVPPNQRLGFMKDLIDHARLGEDAQLRDILSNYVLLRPHPYYDTHLFPKHSRAYCTIAQAASNYCKKFWKADVKLVVYNRVPQPYDGAVR